MFARISVTSLLIITSASLTFAQSLAPKVKVETLVENLSQPCAVVQLPGTQVVYVAEAGEGRVVKIADEANAKAVPVVIGFPKAKYGAADAELGPISLGFISPTLWLAAGSGAMPGETVAHVYKLPSSADPLPHDKAEQTVIVAKAAADQKNALPVAVFVTPSTSSSPSMIGAVVQTELAKTAHYLAGITNNKLGDFKASPAGMAPLANKLLPGPPALALHPKKGFFVVVEAAADTADSAASPNLAFYSAKQGKLLMRLPLKLADVSALAYSPKTDRLYAATCAADGQEAALYRIDAKIENGKQAIEAVRVAPLERPAAMAFSNEGTLYVADFGAVEKDASAASGKLVKITKADANDL